MAVVSAEIIARGVRVVLLLSGGGAIAEVTFGRAGELGAGACVKGVTIGVGEVEAEDVIAVEAVSLEGVDDHGGLEGVLEVGEAEDDGVVGAFPLDEAD